MAISRPSVLGHHSDSSRSPIKTRTGSNCHQNPEENLEPLLRFKKDTQYVCMHTFILSLKRFCTLLFLPAVEVREFELAWEKSCSFFIVWLKSEDKGNLRTDSGVTSFLAHFLINFPATMSFGHTSYLRHPDK